MDRRIERIIELYLPTILSGEATLDSVLAKYPQYAVQLRQELEAILWLNQAKLSLEPRKSFLSSSRRYIEGQYPTIQPHNFWQRIFRQHTPQRWAFNLTAPAIILLLLGLIMNNLVLTARLSLPGDALYPVKLMLEEIQVVATINPVEKAELNIQLSRQRTTEFVDLVLEGDYSNLPSAAARLEAEIIASLHSLNKIDMLDQQDRLPATQSLRETLSNEIVMLRILKSSSPPAAYPGIELAIQVAQTGLLALR